MAWSTPAATRWSAFRAARSRAFRRSSPASRSMPAARWRSASSDGGIVIRGGAHDGRRFDQANGQKLNCPTAALFLDANTLIVANGAAQHSPSQWRRDLMTLGRSGTVWRIDLATGERRAAGEPDRLAVRRCCRARRPTVRLRSLAPSRAAHRRDEGEPARARAHRSAGLSGAHRRRPRRAATG